MSAYRKALAALAGGAVAAAVALGVEEGTAKQVAAIAVELLTLYLVWRLPNS